MTHGRYLFDHIPRTGGMSMKAIFDDLFGPENVSPIIRWQNASQVMAQMETMTMITGHFWHSPGSLVNRRRLYLTLLRRPEDRTLSLYYFFRHNVQDEDEAAVRLAKAMDLRDFLMGDDPAILQVIRDFAVHHFRRLSPDGYSTATEGAQGLTAAKVMLEQYDFVGIHEAFADSLDLMCYRFGWPAIRAVPAVNQARERRSLDDLPPELRSRLRELNAFDIELYEHGRSLFAERRRAMMTHLVDLGSRGRAESAESAEIPALQAAPIASPSAPSIEFGDRMVEILAVEIKGASSGTAVVRTGEEVVIAITAMAHGASDDFTVGIAVRDASHQLVFGTNSHHLGERWSVRPGAIYEVGFRMRMTLGDGVYLVTVALHEGPAHFQHCFHWREDAVPFEVLGRQGAYFQGRVDLAPTLVRRESSPLGVFAADLSSEGTPDRATTGAAFAVPVRIRNTGGETWPKSGPWPVHASYRWLDASGSTVLHEGLRTALPRDMPPGDETALDVRVETPAAAGTYVLRITLVQETWAWFDDHGAKPLNFTVSVDAA
jgi:hypothetical protein